MSEKDQKVLDGLFRDLVKVYSSSETSLKALNCIVDAMKELSTSNGGFERELYNLITAIKNTQPRMYPLDNLIVYFENELEKNHFFKDSEIDKAKKGSIQIIENLQSRLNDDLKNLAHHGTKCIEDGDLIIVHSVEEPVEIMIPAAAREGKKFEVLILKQDFVKTRQVIKTIKKENIDYFVIPEWDLVHYFDKADKLFVGAFAVTDDNKFISDSGTSNIVSECHLNKLPVYLFVLTLEFTHRIASDQNIYLKSEEMSHDGIDYALASYSSDVIDLNFVDHIITEKGEVSREDIPNLRVI
tara:strand:+ start:12736 stop:13632 length:897 start_codon:yes stop_codon:yes gene_type:complete